VHLSAAGRGRALGVGETARVDLRPLQHVFVQPPLDPTESLVGDDDNAVTAGVFPDAKNAIRVDRAPHAVAEIPAGDVGVEGQVVQGQDRRPALGLLGPSLLKSSVYYRWVAPGAFALLSVRVRRPTVHARPERKREGPGPTYFACSVRSEDRCGAAPRHTARA
jgi:hypothetical protein